MIGIAVAAVAGGPVLVPGFSEVRFAVFEGGGFADIEVSQRDVGVVGNAGDGGREPADAEALEQVGAAIHRSADR